MAPPEPPLKIGLAVDEEVATPGGGGRCPVVLKADGWKPAALPLSLVEIGVKRQTGRMDMLQAKWVRIMCDYCADPLWGPDGTMGDLADLPVSDDLRARLEAWEAWYDVHSLDNPEFDRAAFGRHGLGLAREVKTQLPDWTIIYFDEAAAAGTPPGAARETFEYEIGR